MYISVQKSWCCFINFMCKAWIMLLILPKTTLLNDITHTAIDLLHTDQPYTLWCGMSACHLGLGRIRAALNIGLWYNLIYNVSSFTCILSYLLNYLFRITYWNFIQDKHEHGGLFFINQDDEEILRPFLSFLSNFMHQVPFMPVMLYITWIITTQIKLCFFGFLWGFLSFICWCCCCGSVLVNLSLSFRVTLWIDNTNMCKLLRNYNKAQMEPIAYYMEYTLWQISLLQCCVSKQTSCNTWHDWRWNCMLCHPYGVVILSFIPWLGVCTQFFSFVSRMARYNAGKMF